MPETQQTMDLMAGEIFELYKLIAMARSRRTTPEDLSELEFLTLDALYREEQPLTVGEVQKRVGVVPAQMSRIIRALEEQGGKGFLASKINAEDRRRIDISLTDSGRAAYEDYRSIRIRSMQEVLSVLPPPDRSHFMRILGQIRAAFEARMSSGS